MSATLGTTLIAVASPQGIVMAADDFAYKEQEGKAVPAGRGVRKVFFAGNRLLVGSAGIVENDEYKLEDWITGIIEEHRGTAVKRPTDLAAAIDAKMRTTFKPIEAFVEQGCWSSHGPRDWLVHYIVAGYSEKFQRPYMFEVGARIDAKGTWLVYVSRTHHVKKLPFRFSVGEDKYWPAASNGTEPPASFMRSIAPTVEQRVLTLLPNVPRDLQEWVLNLVCFIQVEAKFNPDKVGATVNVVLIDRAARKPYAAVI